MLVVRVTGQLVQHLLHLSGGQAGQQVLQGTCLEVWPQVCTFLQRSFVALMPSVSVFALGNTGVALAEVLLGYLRLVTHFVSLFVKSTTMQPLHCKVTSIFIFNF